MSDFVDDNLDLANFPKVNVVTPIGTQLTQTVTADDMNGIRSALLSLKTHVRAGSSGSPIAAATIAGNNTGATGAATGLTDVQAKVVLGIDNISVKDSTFGAVGNWNPITNTGTDDRAAFTLAIAAAIAAKKPLTIPPGTYKLSKRLDVANARGLRIIGSAFATIYYPSDDITVVPDAIATSNAQARAALFLKNCQDVSIENVIFVGGNSPELTSVNTGVGIYATNCTGTRVTNCRALYGNTLFVQDAIQPTSYAAGNSCSVAAGIVTLTNAGDPNGAFNTGMIGRTVTITNATNPVNNGVFPIQTVLSSTQLTYTNVSGITEATSGLTWTISDGDFDTVIHGCSFINCRGVAYTGSGGTFSECTFQRPMTQDMAGIPDFVACAGTTSVLTDANSSWTSAVVGGFIKIAGSTTTANNGLFPITAVTVATQNVAGTVTFTNAAGGTSELCPFTTCYWWIPRGEKVGKGNGAGAIVSSAGIVTFTASQGVFAPSDVYKVLVVTDATSTLNNGPFVIQRYISATQVQINNSGATSEAYAGLFTIDGYDSTKGDQVVGPPISRTSTGVGVGSLTDTGLAMTVNAYASRILVDSAGVNWVVNTNTATVFTLTGAGTPASGAYTVSAGDTHGSTHGIYYFAGRSQCKVINCRFYGVRTTAIKISGSSLPIRDVEIAGNTFLECGAATIWGADDSQEHTSLNFHHNQIQDCATGRQGWNDQFAVGLYGGRNVQIHDNQFHAKHDAIPGLVNTGSLGGYFPIFVGRYRPGISQPCEDVSIRGNSLTGDPYSTAALRIAGTAIHCERVGQRAKWGSTGTLTKSGNTMTLTDANAEFSQVNVGDSIQISFAPDAGNNSTTVLETKVGEWTVLAVIGSGALTFTNAAGVGGGVAVGTYRIKPKPGAGGRRGGTCIIADNRINGYGSAGIDTVSCTGPEIRGNIFNGIAVPINDIGSVAPRIVGNREVAPTTTGARITLTTGTSWPFIADNYITNGALLGGNLTSEAQASRTDMGIGVGNTTSLDYPLRGKSGRAIVTGAHAELMLAFGSDLVDGDTFALNGSIFTYKTTAPSGNQFNTLALLLTKLTASGMTAVDYGTPLAGSPTTGHIKVFGTATTAAANAYYIDTINALNETALVIPRNDVGGGEALQYSRGEGDAGPVSRRLVVWSPLCAYAGAAFVTPYNAAAAASAMGLAFPEKNIKNAGCCEVLNVVGTVGTTAEFQWMVP